MSKNKGFTLIELLVVIAIIGILAAVVLASLNSARDSANDASVKSQLANMRAQAEIFYTQNGNYAAADGTEGQCTDDADSSPSILTADETGSIANLIAGVDGNNGSASVTCSVQTDQWAVSSALADGTAFCVDSTGSSASSTASGGVCP